MLGAASTPHTHARPFHRSLVRTDSCWGRALPTLPGQDRPRPATGWSHPEGRGPAPLRLPREAVRGEGHRAPQAPGHEAQVCRSALMGPRGGLRPSEAIAPGNVSPSAEGRSEPRRVPRAHARRHGDPAGCPPRPPQQAAGRPGLRSHRSSRVAPAFPPNSGPERAPRAHRQRGPGSLAGASSSPKPPGHGAGRVGQGQASGQHLASWPAGPGAVAAEAEFGRKAD